MKQKLIDLGFKLRHRFYLYDSYSIYFKKQNLNLYCFIYYDDANFYVDGESEIEPISY